MNKTKGMHEKEKMAENGVKKYLQGIYERCSTGFFGDKAVNIMVLALFCSFVCMVAVLYFAFLPAWQEHKICNQRIAAGQERLKLYKDFALRHGDYEKFHCNQDAELKLLCYNLFNRGKAEAVIRKVSSIADAEDVSLDEIKLLSEEADADKENVKFCKACVRGKGGFYAAGRFLKLTESAPGMMRWSNMEFRGDKSGKVSFSGEADFYIVDACSDVE